jgi:hypothetical protein
MSGGVAIMKDISYELKIAEARQEAFDDVFQYVLLSHNIDHVMLWVRLRRDECQRTVDHYRSLEGNFDHEHRLQA